MPKHNERENLSADEKKARHESARMMHQIPADYPADLAWPRVFGFRVKAHHTGYSEPGATIGAYATVEEAQAAMEAAVNSGDSMSWRGRRNLDRRISDLRNAHERAVYDAREKIRNAISPFLVAKERAETIATEAYYAERNAAEKEHETAVKAAQAARHSLTFDSDTSKDEIAAAVKAATAGYIKERAAAESVINEKTNKAYDTRSAALLAAQEGYETATAGFNAAYDAERDKINAEYDALIDAARKAAYAGELPHHETVQVTWRDKMEADISGQSLPVWHNQYFWQTHTEIHGAHLVRVSVNDSELLSYVADNAKGQRGIRTPIRPGKYLTQYFGDMLTEKQIAFFAQWQITGAKPNPFSDPELFPLAFAVTPDEIEYVYKHGPSSCMDASHYWREGESPVRVYGAGDLAVAHLVDAKGTQGESRDTSEDDEDDDNDDCVRAIPARCLVWPEKKIMGRVYPAEGNDAHAELKNRLIRAGYVSLYTDRKLFNGARLLKNRIEPGKYSMPYLDIVTSVVDAGEYFKIKSSGSIGAQQTCGYIRVEEPRLCAKCGVAINRYDDSYSSVYTGAEPSGSNEAQYHDACLEESAFYRCAGHGVRFACDVPHTTVEGRVYSNGWLASNAVFSEYSNQWFINTRGGARIFLLDDSGSIVSKLAARREYITGRDAGTFVTCSITGRFWESRFIKTCAITGTLFGPGEAHPDFSDVKTYTEKADIAEHMKLSGSRAATQRAIKAAQAGLNWVPTRSQAKHMASKAA